MVVENLGPHIPSVKLRTFQGAPRIDGEPASLCPLPLDLPMPSSQAWVQDRRSVEGGTLPRGAIFGQGGVIFDPGWRQILSRSAEFCILGEGWELKMLGLPDLV